MRALVAWLAAAVCANAMADVPDPEAAWQAYMARPDGGQPAMSFPYQHCFRQAAARHALPLPLLLAVARGESDFDPSARSHANAHGLMQILWPETATDLGIRRLSELYVPCKNVEAGTRYLKSLLERYGGNAHLALAAYNYGPARIPGDGAPIPPGARWYSAYIYRHLEYVLGRDAGSAPAGGGRDYLAEGKATLIEFEAPYRAEAYARQLAASAPGVRLDWFRVDARRFRVVVLFADEQELGRVRGQLGQVGIRLP